MRKNNLILLVLIILFAVMARVVFLEAFPPSLNWDEVSLGYNAYSLLHTGKDEWGQVLPLIFRAFGDYKLPLYVYLAVLSIKVFGLATLGVKLPSIICGVLLVPTTYFLVRKVIHDPLAAIIAALLVCFQPWTLFLSRVAVEANVAAFFIAFGVLCYLVRRYTYSFIFLGLSVWAYNSARIFVPLFLLSLWLRELIVFRRLVSLNIFRIVILGVLFLPLAVQLLSPSGVARYGWISLLDTGAINRINESRSQSHLPSPLARLVHNKVTYFVSIASVNYFNHFLPSFLFFTGGSHYQFNIPGSGLLSAVNLPFFYLGLFWLLRSKNPNSKVVLLWLLLAPLPGSITRDSPHTLRAVTMLPLPMILSAIGVSFFATHFSRRVFVILFLIAQIASSEYYITTQIPNYRTNFSWAWQYGYSQMVDYIRTHYSEYDQIIITKKYGEPHEFVLFYWPIPPSQFLSDPNLVRYFRTDWYWTDSFAKFKFVNDWDMPTDSSLPANGKYLVVSTTPPVDTGLIQTRIDFLNGQPAFYIWEKLP